jgi:hypothetical protein
VELALKSRVPVIPVCVRGVKVPAVEQLPEGIQGLSYRNAVSMSPQPGGDDGLEQLHRDLGSFLYTAGFPKGSIRRDAAGRYVPEGVWFKEVGGDWQLGARMDGQPTESQHWESLLWWALAFLLFISMIYSIFSIITLDLSYKTLSDALTTPPAQQGPPGDVPAAIPPSPEDQIAEVKRLPLRDRIYYFSILPFLMDKYLIYFLSFLIILINILTLNRKCRNYFIFFLISRFGRSVVSRRKDRIRVREGVPLFSRSVEAEIASVESIETRENGFGLVINRGGLLQLVECFEFGKNLSIRKRLFISRALARLLEAKQETNPGNDSPG